MRCYWICTHSTYIIVLCVSHQKTLEASGKELSSAQLERIVDAERTQNPLFLKTAMTVSTCKFSEICVTKYCLLSAQFLGSVENPCTAYCIKNGWTSLPFFPEFHYTFADCKPWL